MLGRGSKFVQAGYTVPKPLIRIRNKYMFEWALESISFLNLKKDCIFIILKQHRDEYHLDEEIRKTVGTDVHIDIVDFIPEGAAKTVLLVRSHIDNNEELIIYNYDQFFVSSLKQELKNLPDSIDGLIPIFPATNPKWSYVETNDKDFIIKTAEKEVISNKATIGLYYFKKGKDFVWAADQMISKQLMVGGEYYVCPVYNELIQAGKKIKALSVTQMWSLGTPEDVQHFERYYKGDIL